MAAERSASAKISGQMPMWQQGLACRPFIMIRHAQPVRPFAFSYTGSLAQAILIRDGRLGDPHGQLMHEILQSISIEPISMPIGTSTEPKAQIVVL